MVIPFLSLLFGTSQKIYTVPKFEYSVSYFIDYLNYILTTQIESKGEAAALLNLCLIILILFFLRNFCRYVSLFFMSPIRNGIVHDIRVDMYDKILSVNLPFLSKKKKGDIISRHTADLVEIEWSIMSAIEMIFKDPITIIIFLITLFYINFNLTLFVLALFPLTGFVIAKIGKNLKKSSQKGQNEMGLIVNKIEETITHIKTIKIFNLKSYMKNKFQNDNYNYKKSMTSILRKKDMSSPLSEFLSVLVLIIIMWVGGKMALSNSGIQPEVFIGFVAIFSQIIPPAKSFTTALYLIQKGNASAERINEILEIKNIENINSGEKITSIKKSIKFKNVSFSFGNKKIFRNLNLDIKKGETIAIVGHSGSGKSTLINLLLGFYEIENGEILIDNKKINCYKKNNIRNIINVVSQETILFNDSIMNNLTLGKEYDLKTIKQACKQADADDFINKLEGQYKYNITEYGQNISVGQKQRINIARTIIKNPEVIIFDEATSSLDQKSEKKIFKFLKPFINIKTSIIISHKLSTLKSIDKIYVLDRGGIIESGNHGSLMKQKGHYYNLYNSKCFY
tara:strand:+ start:356 stop:2056 length:1701 start_codon:yes stop_codon:yes gene_type:complete